MGLFGPPPEAPEGVRRVLDILETAIERAVACLTDAQQGEFWHRLQVYAGTERQKQGRSARLLVAPQVEESVRCALETIDGDIATNLADLNTGGRQRFWTVLDEICRRQISSNRQAPGSLHSQSGS